MLREHPPCTPPVRLTGGPLIPRHLILCTPDRSKLRENERCLTDILTPTSPYSSCAPFPSHPIYPLGEQEEISLTAMSLTRFSPDLNSNYQMGHQKKPPKALPRRRGRIRAHYQYKVGTPFPLFALCPPFDSFPPLTTLTLC